jgi:hypothetical protein
MAKDNKQLKHRTVTYIPRQKTQTWDGIQGRNINEHKRSITLSQYSAPLLGSAGHQAKKNY